MNGLLASRCITSSGRQKEDCADENCCSRSTGPSDVILANVMGKAIKTIFIGGGGIILFVEGQVWLSDVFRRAESTA